ncbi:hypothetical protein MACH09_32090 [Vibrio sp. MACH09]|uniref:hypothetical protein n=1 Tax=Vibrio sp. MACH09 TaxID=3025122 RepID=UPI0027904462|nr:hypothetical protein [Vibrio sp. MACH09]GLO62701.1 hypothetical protein MACH09_32090 [Vibrio sp. MACH09]
MSSILSSQITTTENQQISSKLKDTFAEIAALATMFTVTATIVLLMSLSWVN